MELEFQQPCQRPIYLLGYGQLPAVEKSQVPGAQLLGAHSEYVPVTVGAHVVYDGGGAYISHLRVDGPVGASAYKVAATLDALFKHLLIQ